MAELHACRKPRGLACGLAGGILLLAGGIFSMALSDGQHSWQNQLVTCGWTNQGEAPADLYAPRRVYFAKAVKNSWSGRLTFDLPDAGKHPTKLCARFSSAPAEPLGCIQALDDTLEDLGRAFPGVLALARETQKHPRLVGPWWVSYQADDGQREMRISEPQAQHTVRRSTLVIEWREPREARP